MLGVGTDMLKISHLSSKGVEPGDSFLRKVYTPKEVEEANKREVPLYYFATRFAGKEAVFKALGLSSDNIRLNEIEIINDEKGRPQVRLLGNMALHAAKEGIGKVLISLSYDTEYAIAFACACE